MEMSQKPVTAMTTTTRPQQPLVTQKKLANLVAEMMQGIEKRMGSKSKSKVTASAA
jgi:hypothetical protein